VAVCGPMGTVAPKKMGLVIVVRLKCIIRKLYQGSMESA
jgi:hypothetical protein